ncbi:hypothetical protein ACO0OL_002801 [Hanseniaspora opuntiae]
MGIQHPQLTLLTIDEKDTLTYSQIDLHTPYMPLLVYGMLSVLSVLYLFFYTFRIEGNDYRKKNMKLFFYRLMILSL